MYTEKVDIFAMSIIFSVLFSYTSADVNYDREITNIREKNLSQNVPRAVVSYFNNKYAETNFKTFLSASNTEYRLFFNFLSFSKLLFTCNEPERSNVFFILIVLKNLDIH